jgi:hypothetical protein
MYFQQQFAIGGGGHKYGCNHQPASQLPGGNSGSPALQVFFFVASSGVAHAGKQDIIAMDDIGGKYEK